MAIDQRRIEALVSELIEAIGEDPARAGLELTPQRVAASFAEFFAGIGEDAAAPLQATIPVADASGELLPSGAVMMRDVQFRSMCEHHLLPFRGVAHIAYLPRERVVGLGALPRSLDILAARPQVQERLGEQFVDTLMGALDARGALIVLDASHECVTMRGGRQPITSTVTVAARGELADTAARAEIIALLQAPGESP